MKFTLTTLFCLSLSSSLAWSAPQLRSAKALTVKIENNQLNATLTTGFHFNEKAPNGIQVGSQFTAPTLFEKQKLLINPLPKDYSTGVAHLYVCDDAVTFCEIHKIEFNNKAAPTKSKGSSKTSPQKDKHGFLLNDFEYALNQALKHNKILIVDFTARWCPGCWRLDSEIFNKKEFTELTKGFLKFKIDNDIFANAPLLTRFKIRGYPSILFLTAKGEEITRFYDYQPMSTIKTIVEQVQKFPVAIADLEKLAPTPETNNILWPRYMYSSQYEKALAILDKNPVKPKEYQVIKIEMAANAAKLDAKFKDEYIKTLKTAIQAEPESSRSLLWRQSLIDELPSGSKEIKMLANDADHLTDQLLQNPEKLKAATQTDALGEYTGLETFYVAFVNAEISDAAEREPVQAWQKAVKEGNKQNITAKQPGPALRLSSALIGAQLYDEAFKLVEDLLKQKPNDGNLLSRRFSVLFRLKRYDEAAAAGEKALKYSYGANEFHLVDRLAQTYMAQNQNVKAKGLLAKYLSRNEINFANMAGIKESLEQLNQKL